MKIFSIQVAIVSIDAGYSASVINAIGKPKYGMVVMIVSLFLIPGFVYVGSFWGLIGVVWGMVAYSGIFFVINQLILRHLCQFRLLNLPSIIFRVIGTLLPMFLVGLLVIWFRIVPKVYPPKVLSFDWFMLGLRMAGAVLLCLILYGATAYYTMREDVLFLLRGISGALRRK